MVIPDYFTMFNQRIWRQEAQGEEPQQQPTPSASTEPQQNAGAQQQTTPRDGSDSSESSLHIVEDYWFGPNSPSRNDQQKSTSQQPPPQLLPYVEDPNAIELENINPQQASGAQLQKTPRDGSDSGESNLEIVKDYVENLPQPPPQLNPNAAEDPIAIELENINPQQTRAGGNQQQQVQEPPKADDGTAINIEVRGFAGTLVLRFLASFCISNTKNRQRRENFAPAQADGGGDDVDGDIAPDLGPPRPPQDLPVKGYIFLCLG
ncbi:hypothetical protein B0H65DRAFT_314262 [Neurospora tetraspora]|uniref:Uncharacterized protein n=1 Tax=Neurospora tetraspora TaxID=94610 RepID=A0AAE0J782_9PEZI|nr:hypothetical protein B0H65DRAFT_314262 [Neurospora tetraspora]